MAKSKYAKYIVTELKMPEDKKKIHAEYSKYATRILWMDDKVVPGAFQMNCSWYLKPPKEHVGRSHRHDVPEIIGFFGSDHTRPYDLGAEIEFWLEDEKFLLTKTCMIFVPPGMRHCPLIVRRIDRPVFHFTTVTSGQYEMRDIKEASV